MSRSGLSVAIAGHQKTGKQGTCVGLPRAFLVEELSPWRRLLARCLSPVLQ